MNNLWRHTRLLIDIRAASIALLCTLGLTAFGQTVPFFDDVGIQFGGDANWNSQGGTTRLDNGRVVERVLQLPDIPANARVTTQLNIWAAEDHWDRAGNIQLVNSSGSVELHKFITGFGGTTSHQQDVTNLIPFLRQGPTTVRAFIDTWVPAAWTIDFSLDIEQADTRAPAWNRQVFNDQDWRAGKFADNKRSISVPIPPDMEKVYLNYLTSGHASDGAGGDEFTQRRHRIWIDGVEVFNHIPWRTDGRDFRSVNPWSACWPGDVCSSDLPRSGWIPGDDVDPYVIDVTQYLTSGRHTIEYQIEGIEPDDGDGYGYWRTSSYITGFLPTEPNADFDRSGHVDGRDFLIWQRNYGRTAPLINTRGDANFDGTVDGADLAEWSLQFGNASLLASIIAVPEPTTLAAGALFCTLLINTGRQSWPVRLSTR